jgi:hypothetical protein
LYPVFELLVTVCQAFLFCGASIKAFSLSSAFPKFQINELTLYFQEANPPRTTLQSWHEKTTGPEQVTVEKDEYGNVIK